MLQATGDTVLWADLFLSLKTNRGIWKQFRFRVDPGTEMTTLPAYDAKSLDLPIPKKPVSNLVLYGQEVRSGLLRAGRRYGPDRFRLPLLLRRRPGCPAAASAESPGIDRCDQPNLPHLRRQVVRAFAPRRVGRGELIAARCPGSIEYRRWDPSPRTTYRDRILSPVLLPNP